MATEAPIKFTDPLYASLDDRVTQKLGLPAGLLASIRTKGERSNADQVSEAGAKSVYQIIPATRKAVLDKYGIDAYLSPENAAEAAGLLLKESLDRNKGDTAIAVAEYHGGTDRSNWGPRTKAYVGRVTGGAPAPAAPQGPNIARAYDAYRAGRMAPEDAAEFEADVNSGAISLPLGASLIRRAAPEADSFKVPQSVIDAYKAGKMTPQDAAEFEADMRANPSLVPEGLTIKPFRAEIPGQTEGAPSDVSRAAPDPTLGQQAIGLGEAGLTLATGMTGGTVGAIKGGLQGLLDPNVTNIQQFEQSVQQGAESLTYAPRTEVGQERAQQLGNIAANAIPIAPLAPQMAAVRRAGQAAKPTAQVLAQTVPQVARETAATAAQNVAAGARAIPERVGQMVGREPAAPTPGTMGSVGSAAVDMATQRRMAAQELPVPIKLTEGQATRSFEQQRFEGETAKSPEAGAPIRDRFTQQNQQVIKNLDAYIDQSGATAPDLRSAGIAVDKALRDQLARDKTEVRAKYKAAEKAGELEAPVSTEGLTSLLNESTSAEGTAKVLGAAKKELQRLGGASLDENGVLIPGEMTLKSAEELRKFINANMDVTGPDLAYGPRLKSAIDTATEGVGGQLYKDARAARQRVAQNFEDRASISRILNNKPGTSDRQIAFEDVFKHSILDGSLDDVRNVRRVLQRGGEDGQQAWKELQGQTVNHIREQATKNVARDQAGNQIVSAAGMDRVIKQLDADGKLDFIFGKQGAEQLRTINDVTNHIKTVAPGAINTSNTASVLLAALDMGISGAGGMPLPIASGLRLVVNNVKDRRLRMRVAQALGDVERKAAARPKPIEGVSPNKKRTIH